MFKKDDIPTTFITFKSWAEKHFSNTIKNLHTDGGGEFKGGFFQNWLRTEGIEHITTPSYSPDMNGACEV